MPLSGILAESFGWETVFYVFGGLGTLWFMIWCFLTKGDHFVADKEEKSCEEKGISNQSNGEGSYIIEFSLESVMRINIHLCNDILNHPFYF